MKTLLIARHGKAEDHSLSISDFERKLKQRGKEDLNKVVSLVKTKFKIQHIVSSPAKRAYQTAKIYAKIFDIEKSRIELNDRIYEANLADLLKVINNLNDEFDNICICGHNPSFEYVIEYLTGEEILELPTSGVGAIEFQFNSWNLISAGTGSLKALICP